MTRDEFKRIVERYECDIKETEECIEITHSVGREKFSIGLKPTGSLYGDKRLNNSIYAGFGTPNADEESLLYELNEYKFVLKNQQQMSIFDL